VAASQYKKEKKIATKSRPNETHNNMYVGSPYCRAKIYVDESRYDYADGTDRQTDGRTRDRYITLSAVNATSVTTTVLQNWQWVSLFCTRPDSPIILCDPNRPGLSRSVYEINYPTRHPSITYELHSDTFVVTAYKIKTLHTVRAA